MIYDYLRRAWVKRKSQKITCFATIDSKLYSAGKKIYQEYNSSEFDGKFIEAFYKCTPLNLGIENSKKILAYPPKITMDMYYSNDFFIEYTRDYNSMTTKIRRMISRTLRNVLYFDKGFWDSTYFPRQKISAIKKLPTSFFKTLQMSFYTKELGQNF